MDKGCWTIFLRNRKTVSYQYDGRELPEYELPAEMQWQTGIRAHPTEE